MHPTSYWNATMSIQSSQNNIERIQRDISSLQRKLTEETKNEASKIDKGLANSRFGIVVLSPSFFAKNWTQYELDGLVAKEMTGGKVILPLWHKVSKDEVMAYSPTLADKVALNTAMFTTDELVKELSDVLK